MTPNAGDFTLWQTSDGTLEVACPICGKGTPIPRLMVVRAVSIRDLIAAASDHARADHPVIERRTA